MKRTVLIAVTGLICLRAHSAYIFPLPDYTTIFWRDYIHIGGLTISDFKYYAGGQYRRCMFQIQDSFTSPDGKNRGGATYMWQTSAGNTGKDMECLGVMWGPWDDKPTTERKIRQALENLPGHPIRNNGGSGWSNLGDGKSCKIIAVIQGPAGYWGSTVPCGKEKPPVNCSFDAPAVISHANAQAGDVHSSARSSARLSCSGKSSVKLKLQSSKVDLTSGRDSITTELSLGDDGGGQAIVVADPMAVIDINSNIVVQGAPAGVFVGSTVLTASWD